jgi:magnesium-transporting ATPase (P-type)
VESDLDKFAREGLRTLVFSRKELSLNEFNNFMTSYTSIKTSVDPNKDEKLNSLFDSMERDLFYLGSSAIEDKLQENVAETIDHIMQANIRVWVLTGDKQETAIEIARSCKLIQEGMKEIILSSSTRIDFEEKLNRFSEDNYEGVKLAIIIDGQTLVYALSDDTIAQKFFNFGIKANSVVCCRVSPKQKADVVGLAKK